MSEGGPLVSVVITNHNYGRYLRDCLDSALAQSHARCEVIVVDDGSTDDSRDVLKTYGERVRVLWQENAGQLAAFNTGCAAARGEIICLLDADDAWTTDKVAEVVAAFEANPRAQWLRHSLAATDERLTPVPNARAGVRSAQLIPPDALLFAERVIRASTSAIALRGEAARRVFPLTAQAGDYRFDADAVLLARCAALGFWGYSLPKSLGYYRRHGAQQYVGRAGYERMFERQLAVNEGICRELGIAEMPLASYKVAAVLAALRGQALRNRGGLLLRGLLAARRLVSRPGLLLRQVVTLLYAVAAPSVWLRHMERNEGVIAR